MARGGAALGAAARRPNTHVAAATWPGADPTRRSQHRQLTATKHGLPDAANPGPVHVARGPEDARPQVASRWLRHVRRWHLSNIHAADVRAIDYQHHVDRDRGWCSDVVPLGLARLCAILSAMTRVYSSILAALWLAVAPGQQGRAQGGEVRSRCGLRHALTALSHRALISRQVQRASDAAVVCHLRCRLSAG